MVNGFLAFLLGLALQFASGALASLRPVAALKNVPPAAAAPSPVASVNLQAEGPVTTVIGGIGGLDFCLGTDPAALRQAAADALGLTPEALAEELAGVRTLGELADEHGVSRDTLLAALQAAAQDDLRARLDPLVAAGDLTQEQADALLALQATRDLSPLLDLPFFFAVPTLPGEGEVRIWPDHLPDFPGGLPPMDEAPFAFGAGGFAFRFQYNVDGQPFTFELNGDSPAVRAALAKALGLSEADLAARLDSGERLADIAAAQGVDPQALQEAWRDAGLSQAHAELDKAVAEGTLTQAQADEIFSQIERSLSGSRFFPSAGPLFREHLDPALRWPFLFEERNSERPAD